LIIQHSCINSCGGSKFLKTVLWQVWTGHYHSEFLMPIWPVKIILV
jgi:hypothetical protein